MVALWGKGTIGAVSYEKMKRRPSVVAQQQIDNPSCSKESNSPSQTINT